MRIISHLLTLGAAILMVSCSSGVVIENPRCEWLSSPINIGTPQPRFSWEYSATEGHQKSYRLIVAADEKFENILWDSGKVASDRTMVKYAAEPLESFGRYWWMVETVMDGGNKVKCAPQCFETAALEDYEWQARWITDGYDK
ncbi:MAG: hypothetical protein HUJ91_01955, partial [Bacteroidales bacterium]|nr:hypothetical protein [Bacteroidales bacterium]